MSRHDDRFAEKLVRITGAGQSEVGRPSAKGAMQLTLDACLAAIADAGLEPAHIDGLSTWPGATTQPPGYSPVGSTELMFALDVRPTWISSSTEGHSHMASIFNAVHAIASGTCRHVLVYRALGQASATRSAREANIVTNNGTGRVRGGMAWTMPFNAYSAVNVYGLYAQAYMHRYGATDAQLGAIAVNGRSMAALNPNAVFRTPLSLDEYLDSRVISSPLRLFDCDVPIDGATAIVLSHRDAAADGPRPPLAIEAMGMSIGGIGVGRHQGDFTNWNADQAGEMLWSRTDLTPADVDTAQLYDGFSILAILWMESLKLCGRGEAAAFIEGGKRIGLDGELPLNTSGGQLSQGRLHGYGHIYEACVQLWGAAGARQVRDAKVAAVSAGGEGFGALLLRRDE